MSKYKPLERHLRASKKRSLTLTFSQIEKILGVRLPDSARRHAAWWSNNEGSHVQAQAWMDPGYRTEEVDLSAEKLTFVADSGLLGKSVQSRGNIKPGTNPLFGSMRGTSLREARCGPHSTDCTGMGSLQR